MATTVERLGRTTNLVHGFIYFSNEASDRYAALGLAGRQQYFAGRAAAMGPVGPDVVVATFYNFNPEVVHAAIPSAWDVASPAEVQAARFRAAADVLDRTCGDIDAAQLNAAIEIATAMVDGVGDAHVAALAAGGVSGIEALVLHAATGQVPATVLQATRAWPDDDWSAAIDSLASRGLVEPDGAFTDAGSQLRRDIEAATNTEAQALVETVGDDRANELCDLLRPVRSALMTSGVFGQPLGGTS